MYKSYGIILTTVKIIHFKIMIQMMMILEVLIPITSMFDFWYQLCSWIIIEKEAGYSKKGRKKNKERN